MTSFNDNTKSIACQRIEHESILVDELGEVFSCLPESQLVAKLGFERGVGQSGYPIKVMLRAYLASYFLNMRNTNSLIRRLQEDTILRQICGFSASELLPHRVTFDRFIDRLEIHQDLIQWCIDQVLSKLYNVLPDFGTVVAVDATDVHSHSDCDRKPVSDIEAGFVIKEAIAGRRKKWAWGYKLHLVADAVYELPIAMNVTPGNVSEVTEMMPVLRATKAKLPWFSPKYIIADKGYDDYKNFEGIVKEFDAEPIIKARAEVSVFGSSARPFCQAGLPLVYRSWDRNKGIQYQCPERTGKATCPLPEKCPLKIIWIRPVHDYRRFGYRVARNTEEWVNLYNHRTAIERINSRLKYERRLDSHCFRGLGKIGLHCRLAVLSLLAGALVRAQKNEFSELRICVRKIS